MSDLVIHGRDGTLLEHIIKATHPEMTPEQISDARIELERHRMTYSIVDKIMADKGVGKRRAQQIVRAANLASIDPDAIPTSNKHVVLEALYQANGSVSSTGLYSMTKGLGATMTLPEMLSVLWANQKQGYVQFREEHGKSGSILKAIRLTPAGRTRAIELRGGTPIQATERAIGPSSTQRGFSGSPRAGAIHAAGIDGTNYRNHRKVAQGGPVEIVQAARPAPEVAGPIDYEPFPDPVIDDKSGQKVGSANVYPYAQGPSGDTHTQYPIAEISVDNYPLITNLIARRAVQGKLEAAAKLLDEGGEPEMALAALDRIKLTDLEEEILRLLEL